MTERCITRGSADPANRLVLATCQDSFHVTGVECNGSGRIDGIDGAGRTFSRVCRGCAACAERAVATLAALRKVDFDGFNEALARLETLLDAKGPEHG